jgi:predicted RND superfamily exporter protein
MRALEARIRAVLEESDLPAEIETDITGNAILINRSADGISRNQLTQVGFAAITILVLVTIAFRSLRMAALSMIPNIVPVVLFFGALGAGAATLNLATALIGSIALGIAIDDTMHYLVAYHRERQAGRESRDAAAYCIEAVGRPITVTSIMIFVGFLSLLISNFVTLREFGYLTSMTMAICLMTDLLLMPALLVRLRA